MKKILTVLVVLVLGFTAFADTYLAYDVKTGSEKQISLRKELANETVKVMQEELRNPTLEETETVRAMSKESDIVYFLDGSYLGPFELGKGKEKTFEWVESKGYSKDTIKFIKVY